MTTATLFQWVELKQDVPDSLVKIGDKGVVLDHLSPTKNQKEPGYTLEVFKDGETLAVISVPISWVTPLPEVWGNTANIDTTTITGQYDKEADVIYLSLGESLPTLTVELGDGVIARYDEKSQAIVGITMIGLRERVQKELNSQIERR